MKVFRVSFELGFVLILSVLLFSCSSDDDDNLKTSDGIVGKWMLTEMKMEFQSTDTSKEGDVELMIGTGVATNNKAENHVVFKDDNTLVSNEGEMEMRVQGSLNGENMNYVVNTGSDVPEVGTWSKSGDKITIVGGGETSVFMIQTLNRTTLKLYTDHLISDFSGEDAVNVAAGDYFKMTLVYTRL